MYLFYFDEVKIDPISQPSFWLGGIFLLAANAHEIEERVNSIAKDTFGSADLTIGTEFHGRELIHGKGSFKGVAIEDRALVLSRLLEVISLDKVHRYYVKVNPKNFVATSESPDEVAFMFLVEQINRYLELNDSVGMMFGDYDEPSINGSVISLSKYKSKGTYWRRSTTIDRIIDTVHFAKSHHSRLIQLADIYLHARQLYGVQNTAGWKQKFCDQIKESGILSCAFRKDWPGEKVWYR